MMARMLACLLIPGVIAGSAAASTIAELFNSLTLP